MNDGLETVLLEPRSEEIKVGRPALYASGMRAREVGIEILYIIQNETSISQWSAKRRRSATDLMDVNSSIVKRILEHEHEVRGGLSSHRLVPGVTTGEAVAGGDNELCGAD